MVVVPSHSDPLVPILLGEEVKGKKTIENPWLSRPLDVHRWSEHPEVVSLVETIWQAHFAAMDLQGKAGPKPKRSFQHQLRVLILDLYVGWLENPELSIGVSLSENAWHTGSRYNALHISKAIIPLIHGLEAAGLIDLAKGSYSGPYAQGIPVLSVHDSFIIDYTRIGELKEAMAIASEFIVGKTLAVEANGLGLLEAFAGEPDVNLDFEAWRETARSVGYLSRLKIWEERKGQEVKSYSMRRRNTNTRDPIRPSSFITYT